MFKTEFGLEPYLDMSKIKKHREIVCKLRCSNHLLVIETGRHTRILFLEIAERVCPLYVKDGLFIIKDKFHFVFCCPSYLDIREQYIWLILERDFCKFWSYYVFQWSNCNQTISVICISFKHNDAILSDTWPYSLFIMFTLWLCRYVYTIICICFIMFVLWQFEFRSKYFGLSNQRKYEHLKGLPEMHYA